MNWRKKVGYVATGAVALGGLFFAGSTFTRVSAGTPADKVTVAGSSVSVMNPNTTVTVLQATMKTSAPEDLILQLTAECSIVTSVTATSNGATATGSGEVDMQVKIDGIPVAVVTMPSQQNAQKPGIPQDDGRVVFCNRVFSMTITTVGSSTDTITTYEKTKATNAFNWAAFNVGQSANHVITVEATFSTSDSSQQAVIGNRTLIVQPTSLAQNQTF
jgi:hypothetical protein